MTDIELLRGVYLSNAGEEPSRFHVWDKGDAVGDSVTPSTYSTAYRTWMRDLLCTFLDGSDVAEPALLSLGCGNAAVEAGLVADGYRVLGVDAMAEAVTLARRKGVRTVRADILTWTPPEEEWVVVYADGLLGHVFDEDQGVRPALERIRSWMPAGRGTLVISNDDPRTDDDTQTHTEVPQFTWLSAPYLKAQAEAAGFQDIWSTWFTYARPVSGPRERTIVTAHS